MHSLIVGSLLAFEVVALGGLAFCSYMLHRTQRVFRWRTGLLDTNWSAYQRAASYDAMMRRWWVNDLDAFLAPEDRAAS